MAIQIELIGCTSVGKSTLAKGILQACQDQGIHALMGDDFVLKQVKLNWIKSYLVRTLLVDLFSLIACLLTWPKNFGFYLFVIRFILQLPTAVAWFEKMNIARNTLKKIGIYEIIRRRGADKQVVLLDEGTLHTAHYLFVHVSGELITVDLSTFVRLVPLPNVVIYLQQDEAVLVERTLARGHKRIPDGSPTQVERFIKRAITTFDSLVQASAIKSRLLVVNSGSKITIASDYQNDPSLVIALKILRMGTHAVNTDHRIRDDPRSQDIHVTPNVPL